MRGMLRGLVGVVAVGMVAGIGMAAAQTPAGADGAGAYATGQYRNLFQALGHSDAEVHSRIEAGYQQLFHGNPNTEAIFFPAGQNANGPLAYITDWANYDARTEGMSYGMMVSVQLNHKAEFDALWNWAMTYMYIADPNHPSHGYFSWSVRTDGRPNDETAAPDGEEYFVMALYFAANRWGNGTGIYDYKAMADRLLHTMRHREVMTGLTKFGTRTEGPETDETRAMIRFVPGKWGDFTDPSYHLPAFYELWARWGPAEDREFWARAAEVSRKFFVASTNPQTGLAPDYANFDGTPKTLFGSTGAFGYDAWRTASNWSVDWAWWGKSPEERVLSDRIQGFFTAQGKACADRYTLEGKPLSAGHPGASGANCSPGLTGTNAVASLAATNPHAGEFVSALWATPAPTGGQRYYDGLLWLMSTMHVGGEYRIFAPK